MTADSLEDENNLSLPDHTDLEAIKQYKKKKLQKMHKIMCCMTLITLDIEEEAISTIPHQV